MPYYTLIFVATNLSGIARLQESGSAVEDWPLSANLDEHELAQFAVPMGTSAILPAIRQKVREM